MTIPAGKFSFGSEPNWQEKFLGQIHTLNQDKFTDKFHKKDYFFVIVKPQGGQKQGVVYLKKFEVPSQSDESQHLKKLADSYSKYVKQGRLVYETSQGFALKGSTAEQLGAHNIPAPRKLEGRVTREEGGTVDAPAREREAPVMRDFVIRNARNPNEIEEITAQIESMDDETYASIFGLNFSTNETDGRVTEKEEKKVEHRHKTPMRDITSAPRETQQSKGKLASRETAATMLQQARNTESRRYQERRKERAAEDKEKRKEIRRNEEKREIKNEEIKHEEMKKSEKIASVEKVDQNAKHRKTH